MIYCDICNRYFHNDRAILSHYMNSSIHNYCHRCQRDFTTFQALKQHYTNSSLHNCCEWCNEDFQTNSELDDHDNEEHHRCAVCNTLFCTEDNLDEHQHENHSYCHSCRRAFRNENNLTQHLNSGTHKAKDHMCPGPGCDRGFVSWGALCLHFESGTCPSGLNRHQLKALVARSDGNNLITNPSRLIDGPSGFTVERTWATERSWNNYAYECFICNKEFNALTSLNQHLQSPVHEARFYRCPNIDCGTEYNTLSSLTQHVENGRCGVIQFREVRHIMDSLTNRIKYIAA